ncbi:hypothetical protein [Noviluteimonas gilva]|uniref:DUF4304 domain-containing protein n=1 Tax=Noviluteimonas gilva TaxID=2682097 RepID=A0A7C9MMC1_9GAMM|nr:hypothetical protein [Lysobacter gilvus]MUV14267.1 hypothetical protein [Lysobacter gilvus]
MDRKLLNKIDAACDEALSQYGFKSPRRGNPLIRLDEDAFGWIGLNRLNMGHALQLNPFIGVHFVSIMKLWDQLNDNPKKWPYKVGQMATVALHLGELAPDVEVFVFDDRRPIEPEAERMARTIVQYGVPWMRAHARIDAILPLLREREGMLGGFPQRIAVALFLQGKNEEATAYLDCKLQEYSAMTKWPEIVESWSTFAEKLKALMVADRQLDGESS